MDFLTSNARIEQTDVPGIWQTIDNQLYKDVDGSIYLVPRYYKTDNYNDLIALIESFDKGDSSINKVFSKITEIWPEYNEYIYIEDGFYRNN